MRCTGVAKSVTLSGFCRLAGSCALPTLIVTVEPVLRRSGEAPSPSKRRIRRPAPPSPRLKSMFDTEIVPGSCLAGSRLGVGATVVAAAALGGAACTALKAATAPTSRPTPPFRSRSMGRRAGRERVALNTVIMTIPQSLIFQRDRGWTLQPTTRAIRHQFHQLDAIFKDGGHATIALPHVRTRPHTIGHLVRRHHQRDDTGAFAQRTHHVQAVERELLECFLAPRRIRSRPAAAAIIGEGGAERIAQCLRGVFKRFELLHHR